MRKVKKLWSLLTAMAMVFALVSCGQSTPSGGQASSGSTQGSQSEEPQEVIHWDYASQNSATHAMGLAHQEFFKAVEERTGGRLVITYHPEGELPINQSEYITACGEGLVDIAAGDVSAVGGSLSSGLLPAMPFLINDYETAHKVIEAIHDSIEADVNKHGCTMLYHAIYPLQQIWGAGSVPTDLSSLAGRVIRSQGTEMSQALSMAGMTPVTISGAEVSSSLSRGVIDGGVTAGITVTAAGWDPYVTWGYLINLTALPCYVVVNQESMDALPDDIRQILIDTAIEYQNNFFDAYVQAAEEEQWEVLRNNDNKVQIVEMTAEDRKPLVEAMVPYWFEYAESMGDQVVADLGTILDILGLEH